MPNQTTPSPLTEFELSASLSAAFSTCPFCRDAEAFAVPDMKTFHLALKHQAELGELKGKALEFASENAAVENLLDAFFAQHFKADPAFLGKEEAKPESSEAPEAEVPAAKPEETKTAPEPAEVSEAKPEEIQTASEATEEAKPVEEAQKETVPVETKPEQIQAEPEEIIKPQEASEQPKESEVPQEAPKTQEEAKTETEKDNEAEPQLSEEPKVVEEAAQELKASEEPLQEPTTEQAPMDTTEPEEPQKTEESSEPENQVVQEAVMDMVKEAETTQDPNFQSEEVTQEVVETSETEKPLEVQTPLVQIEQQPSPGDRKRSNSESSDDAPSKKAKTDTEQSDATPSIPTIEEEKMETEVSAEEATISAGAVTTTTSEEVKPEESSPEIFAETKASDATSTAEETLTTEQLEVENTKSETDAPTLVAQETSDSSKAETTPETSSQSSTVQATTEESSAESTKEETKAEPTREEATSEPSKEAPVTDTETPLPVEPASEPLIEAPETEGAPAPAEAALNEEEKASEPEAHSPGQPEPALVLPPPAFIPALHDIPQTPIEEHHKQATPPSPQKPDHGFHAVVTEDIQLPHQPLFEKLDILPAPESMDTDTPAEESPSELLQAVSEEPRSPKPDVKEASTAMETEEAQSSVEESKNKAEEPQNKAEEPQNKAEETKSKAEESESKAEEPKQKEASTPAAMETNEPQAEESQSKAEELQNKAEEPQSNTDESQSKAEEPQSKAEEPQSNAPEEIDTPDSSTPLDAGGYIGDLVAKLKDATEKEQIRMAKNFDFDDYVSQDTEGKGFDQLLDTLNDLARKTIVAKATNEVPDLVTSVAGLHILRRIISDAKTAAKISEEIAMLDFVELARGDLSNSLIMGLAASGHATEGFMKELVRNCHAIAFMPNGKGADLLAAVFKYPSLQLQKELIEGLKNYSFSILCSPKLNTLWLHCFQDGMPEVKKTLIKVLREHLSSVGDLLNTPTDSNAQKLAAILAPPRNN